jgi:hypothetical protein
MFLIAAPSSTTLNRVSQERVMVKRAEKLLRDGESVQNRRIGVISVNDQTPPPKGRTIFEVFWQDGPAVSSWKLIYEN